MRQGIICFPRLVFCTLMLAGMFTPVFTATAQWPEVQFPEPDPPAVVQSSAETSSPRMLVVEAALADLEWTFHKTLDNQHPDGIEQQMLWLMNRARTDPAGEGLRLATMVDPDVALARVYFDVDLEALQGEFAAIPARPPAAFDVRLYQAARAHSDYLIANDTQEHTDQLLRVENAGFLYGSWRGNVFSYTRSGIHGHAAFNIDWGVGDDTGMQPGRGHRQAIMSLDGDYTNVGLAVVAETDTATGVGPLVTTGNYCSANTAQANHFNRFLVGTVWRDLNDNDQYDPGEGMGAITVQPDRGTYHAITADSGGYALPLLETGAYTVTFSGSGLDSEPTRTVVMDNRSFLLDLAYTNGGPGDPEAGTTPQSAASGGGGGCFIGTLWPVCR